MSKYVKFIGNFRDLIPMGFKFWNAFANNYRVYTKTHDGKEYGQSCSIWQHHGGYLEFDDFYQNSYVIVEQILKGEIEEWCTLMDFSWMYEDEREPVLEKTYWLYFDVDAKTCWPYHSVEYETIRNERWNALEAKDPNGFPYRRYREVVLQPGIIKMIQELGERNMITIAER